MLELSFMPGVLAKDGNHASMRGLTLAAPRDVSQWKRLILALMNHLKSRYGGNAIGKWLFSPWFPPDFADMGVCTREEYAEVYAASFQAIREVLPRAMIVGPGCATGDWDWFFAFCREKGCMPDILSLRSFATADQQEDSQINLVGSNESFPFAVSKDEDILAHSIEALRKKLEAEGLGCKPLVVEEWSSTVWQRDLCNDTCYKSAYLFKNILENNHRVGALGYFSLNDRLEEIPPASETFHGGFGLFTQDGIPKSAYYAMVLLSRLGDKLLSQGDGYLVSQRGGRKSRSICIITSTMTFSTAITTWRIFRKPAGIRCLWIRRPPPSAFSFSPCPGGVIPCAGMPSPPRAAAAMISGFEWARQAPCARRNENG